MTRVSFRDEEFITGLLLLLTAFLWINVDPRMGTFYTVVPLLYLVPLMSRRKDWFVEVLKGKTNISVALAVVVAVLIGWMFLSSQLLSVTGTQVAFTDFFSYLNAQTQMPILSQDPAIRLIGYGIAVPIAETMLFLSFALMFFVKFLKVPLKWHKFGTKNFIKMIWVCGIIGVIGSLFHIQARMMSDVALLADIAFFAISAGLVFRYGQLFEGMMFHILVNTLVILVGMGVL